MSFITFWKTIAKLNPSNSASKIKINSRLFQSQLLRVQNLMLDQSLGGLGMSESYYKVLPNNQLEIAAIAFMTILRY